MTSKLLNKNIRIFGRRTSMRLERELWTALDEVAKMENVDRQWVVEQASEAYGRVQLTSAVRVYLLKYYQERWLKARALILADEWAETAGLKDVAP